MIDSEVTTLIKDTYSYTDIIQFKDLVYEGAENT